MFARGQKLQKVQNRANAIQCSTIDISRHKTSMWVVAKHRQSMNSYAVAQKSFAKDRLREHSVTIAVHTSTVHPIAKAKQRLQNDCCNSPHTHLPTYTVTHPLTHSLTQNSLTRSLKTRTHAPEPSKRKEAHFLGTVTRHVHRLFPQHKNENQTLPPCQGVQEEQER